MNDALLEPWMLRSDWRADQRPWVLIDLAQWPCDLPFQPLPPMPVIAVGSADHPQAAQADIVIAAPFSLDQITASIERKPRTAAAIAALLRATEGITPRGALIAESFAFAMLQAGEEHAQWHGQASFAPQPPGRLDTDRIGDTLHLVIDRPGARNGIDRAMRDALFDAFQLAALDQSIARINLRAAGRCFSMGADLGEFGTTRDPAMAHAIRMRTLPALAALPSAGILNVSIQGACVGAGLELAAFARHITASPDAWFQLPEIGMGILPGAGGTVSVPRRIGRQRAALLMLSGRRINAETALAWGLIDCIVDDLASDHRQDHTGTGQIGA